VRHLALECGCSLYQRVADITEFQVLAPSSISDRYKYKCFEGNYCLHLQGVR
jgi:hypothetical protein